MDACDSSLDRLQTNYLDLYQVKREYIYGESDFTVSSSSLSELST